MNSALGLRAVGLIRGAGINGDRLALLRPSVDMLVVPDLGQHGVAVVGRILAGSCGVEARAGAPDEGNAAVLLG